MKKTVKTAAGKSATGKRHKVGVELDEETNQRVDRLCQSHGITFEQLVHRLIGQDMAKKLGATFKLTPELTRQLQEAARLMTTTPEWFVQEALGSMIESTHEDGTFRSDMQDNYLIDVKRKKKCQVTALESEGAK